MADPFGDDWCYLLTASCGRDYCGSGPLCTEGATNVSVDLTGLTDALPGSECAAAALFNLGTTVAVPGGFGSPFNGSGDAGAHFGFWLFDQTFTGIYDGHAITARLIVDFFIGCVLLEDFSVKLAVSGDVTLICDTGADDTANYGPTLLPRTGPVDCHGSYTLDLGTHGAQFHWPATLTFVLP